VYTHSTSYKIDLARSESIYLYSTICGMSIGPTKEVILSCTE